jgi:hypothetical protein
MMYLNQQKAVHTSSNHGDTASFNGYFHSGQVSDKKVMPTWAVCGMLLDHI